MNMFRCRHWHLYKSAYLHHHLLMRNRKQQLSCDLPSFTLLQLLLARDELKSLKCLEPSQGMRAGFKDAVIDKLPANCSVPVSIEPGTFTQTNAPDNSADLIVIAQAFHWIGREKKDHEAAVRPCFQV